MATFSVNKYHHGRWPPPSGIFHSIPFHTTETMRARIIAAGQVAVLALFILMIILYRDLLVEKFEPVKNQLFSTHGEYLPKEVSSRHRQADRIGQTNLYRLHQRARFL